MCVTVTVWSAWARLPWSRRRQVYMRQHRVWRQCSVGVCLSSKLCHEVSMVAWFLKGETIQLFSQGTSRCSCVQFKGSLRSRCSMCTDDAGRTVLAVGSLRAGRAYWMTSGGEVGDGRSDLKCKRARRAHRDSDTHLWQCCCTIQITSKECSKSKVSEKRT